MGRQTSERMPLEPLTRAIRARLAAGETLAAETFLAVRSHDGLELNLRVTVHGKLLTLADAAKNWQWTGPLVVARRSEVRCA